MKKGVLSLIVLVMMTGIVACGGGEKSAPTGEAEVIVTPTEVPTEEPTPTAEVVEQGVTPKPTDTPKATEAPQPTKEATVTIKPTETPRATETPTKAPTNTQKPTNTAAPTKAPTKAPVATNTPKPTEAPKATATPTATPTEAPAEKQIVKFILNIDVTVDTSMSHDGTVVQYYVEIDQPPYNYIRKFMPTITDEEIESSSRSELFHWCCGRVHESYGFVYGYKIGTKEITVSANSFNTESRLKNPNGFCMVSDIGDTHYNYLVAAIYDDGTKKYY